MWWDFLAPEVKTFLNFFKRKQFFNFFVQKRIFFFKLKLFTKKVFQTKKFCFDQSAYIFEAFHLTLVKKNHQNRERRKRSAYRKRSGCKKKSRAVIG